MQKVLFCFQKNKYSPPEAPKMLWAAFPARCVVKEQEAKEEGPSRETVGMDQCQPCTLN
jgi:hypothetical protein